MYLIDKVVRAKALQGPIGIDNSEVINLEIEKDVEKRNRYLQQLVRKQTSEVSEVEEESDISGDKQANENRTNEKLLKCLYKAAEFKRLPASCACTLHPLKLFKLMCVN